MDAEDDQFEHRLQFVTIGCKGRRQLLNSNLAKRIVLGVLYNAMRKFDVPCVGYVIMPNHDRSRLAPPDWMSVAPQARQHPS